MTEKEALQAKHRAESAEARNRVKERKARTRRLIQEGAILEKVFPQFGGLRRSMISPMVMNLMSLFRFRNSGC